VERQSGLAPRVELGLVALLSAVAVALRGWQLGRAPLWVDEAMSWHFSRLPLADLAAGLLLDSGPPLYYLLLRAWTTLAGDGELALRLPSALAGSALVPALWAVGRRTLGPPIGLAAAAIAALAPAAVAFSREARVYPLLSLAALLALHFSSRWLASRRRAHLVTAWVATAAALYLHNYGLLLLPLLTCLPWLATACASGRRMRDAALLTSPAIALLPWLPTLIAQTRAGAPTAWMAAAWEAHGGFPGVFGASLASLSPGGAQPPYVGIRGLAGAGWWPVALALVALALGCAALLRRPPGSTAGASGRWLLAYLALPPLLAVGLSLAGSPIYLPGRLDQLILPAFCLVAATGLLHIRPRALALAVGTGWLALSAATVVSHLRLPPATDEAGLPSALRQLARAGDTVVCTSLTRAPIEHALRRVDGIRWRSFPAAIERHPGNVDQDALLADPQALRREAEALVADLDGRVLIAFVPDAVDRFLLDRLLAAPQARRARAAGTYRLPRIGLEVTLFELDLGD